MSNYVKPCGCDEDEWCGFCRPYKGCANCAKKDAEIERLTRDLGEARTAAKWLYAWVDESMWTHFDNEDLEVLAKWPWLTGGCE